MIPPATVIRSRWFGLALLLLAVPACGLTDYEKLMVEAQEREERFRAEQKYLGSPVQIPTTKDKEDREIPLASVFFRPPKGVDPKPQQRGIMWRYAADSRSDFFAVEMAFGEDNKDISRSVLESYGRADIAAGTPRQINAPGLRAPMFFDVWEFSTDQKGYSVNILKDGSKPVAIVFIYNKAKQEPVRKVIDLSLQSLGVDQTYSTASMRYNQKTPWKLQGQPGP